MSRHEVPWPASLEGTPAVSMIERAVKGRSLPHSLLFSGSDPDGLDAAGAALSDRILSRSAAGPHIHPDRHPDCFHLRPSGKGRQIKVEPLRDLIAKINVTPAMSDHKVAVIHEADRMNASTSNAFLKTLEEPPPDTTIILLTGQPFSLLATIRSRVLQFRFRDMGTQAISAEWPAWLGDYRQWLARLAAGVSGAKGAADGVFGAYGLAARFDQILGKATDAEVARRMTSLPENLEGDEVEAIKSEIGVGVRRSMFSSLEAATCAHADELMRNGEAAVFRQLAASVDAMERVGGLLRSYLNPMTALEDFLLASLRIWARR
ncbi:MAG TPA: DNA polymerase III subunit gamma/tau [Opitutaceae bacterium]|jgi:DNA polymerase-3 subunit delta'